MSKPYRDMTPEEKIRFLEQKKKSNLKRRTRFTIDLTNSTDAEVIRWIERQTSRTAAVRIAVREYLLNHPEEKLPGYEQIARAADADDAWLRDVLGGRDDGKDWEYTP